MYLVSKGIWASTSKFYFAYFDWKYVTNFNFSLINIIWLLSKKKKNIIWYKLNITPITHWLLKEKKKTFVIDISYHEKQVLT